jgi:hypothetical protein
LEPRHATDQTAGPIGSLFEADASLQVTDEWEMIDFLAKMPTNTKIFSTMAVLGLMASLTVLRGLI